MLWRRSRLCNALTIVSCVFTYLYIQDSSTGSKTEDAKNADAVEREKMINIHSRVRPQRGQNIFAEPLDMGEDYVTPTYPKSDQAIQFIDTSLADNFIFASLTQKERRLLIDAMMLETKPAGTIIIQQGDIGDYFYVVEDGHISFSVDGNH
eukprot:5414656-Ditylum_brightwellii.AAC.1